MNETRAARATAPVADIGDPRWEGAKRVTDVELIFAAANMANSSPTPAWYSDWRDAVAGVDDAYRQLKRRLRGRRRFWLFGRRLGAGSRLPSDVWKYFDHLYQADMESRAMVDEVLRYGRNVTLTERDEKLQAFLENMDHLTRLARSIVPRTKEQPDASAAASAPAPPSVSPSPSSPDSSARSVARPAVPILPTLLASSSFRDQASTRGPDALYESGTRRAERDAQAQISADSPSPQGGGDVMIDWLRAKLSTLKTNVLSARSELDASENHLRMMEERLNQAYKQMQVARRRLDDMSAGTDDIERETSQWKEHLVSRKEYDRLQQHAQRLESELAAKSQQLTEAEQKLSRGRDQLAKVMQDREGHVIRNKELTTDLASSIIEMLDNLSTLPMRNGSTPAATAQDSRGGEREDTEASFLAASQQTLFNSLLAMLDNACSLRPIEIKRFDPYDSNHMSQMGVIPSPDNPRYRGHVAEIIRGGYADRKNGRVFRPATVSVYE